MKVRFKVQKYDDVKEISVARNSTVGEFVASAQAAGFIPRLGVCNIVVRDQSSDLSTDDYLGNSCQSEFLCVSWDECNEQVVRLCEMGFSRESVVRALREADNQAEAAIDRLLHKDTSEKSLCANSSRGCTGARVNQSAVFSQSTHNSCGTRVSEDLPTRSQFEQNYACLRHLKLSADQGNADA